MIRIVRPTSWSCVYRKANRIARELETKSYSVEDPTASIYWAMLNHTRTRVLRRTNVSTMNVVSPLISIGQGCSKSITEASNGIKATEAFTSPEPGRVILRKDESQTIPKTANAASPFQYFASPDGGRDQTGRKNVRPAATDNAAVSRYKTAEFSRTCCCSVIDFPC